MGQWTQTNFMMLKQEVYDKICKLVGEAEYLDQDFVDNAADDLKELVDYFCNRGGLNPIPSIEILMNIDQKSIETNIFFECGGNL